MKAAVGEKGAQGMKPYLTIDVVINASPARWEMEVKRVSAAVIIH